MIKVVSNDGINRQGKNENDTEKQGKARPLSLDDLSRLSRSFLRVHKSTAMLLESSHLHRSRFLFILIFYYQSFVVFVHSITVAHQLPIDISPPITSKRDKTLWIGGKSDRIPRSSSTNGDVQHALSFFVVVQACFLRQANGQVARLLFPQLSER
jgi:hypothetical protein